MKIDKDLICGAILFALYLFFYIHAKVQRRKRPHIYKSKKKTRKPYVYNKTIYKPRKPENKGLPDGNFTHEHVESMWDEIK